jgi:hypothetical protein
MSDVERVRAELRELRTRLDVLATLADQEAEDMVSLTPKETGVQNTLFVSTKGYVQHAPRIKIAIDPPDSFSAASKSASMALHDFKVTGERVPAHIARQAEQFIELNRQVLVDYWEFRIATAELLRRIRPVG